MGDIVGGKILWSKYQDPNHWGSLPPKYQPSTILAVIVDEYGDVEEEKMFPKAPPMLFKLEQKPLGTFMQVGVDMGAIPLPPAQTHSVELRPVAWDDSTLHLGYRTVTYAPVKK